MAEIGTMRVKGGLAEMLKGGVIMDVTDARDFATEAGAVGYLTKAQCARELLPAVLEAAQGPGAPSVN